MWARLLTVAALAAAGSLAWPGSAQAAGVRYASPTGVSSGSCSAPDTACTLYYAMAAAPAGAEVIVLAGSYSVGAGDFLTTTEPDVDVHGAAGQPRPVVTTVEGFSISKDGVRVADLTVIQPTPAVPTPTVAMDSRGYNTTFERLEVHAPGDACFLRDGVLRDSLCTTTGVESAAVGSAYNAPGAARTVRLRNVTAIATGTDDAAVFVNALTGPAVTVDARNVIASGAADVQAVGAGATVVMHSSSFQTSNAVSGATATAAGTGDNQTQSPIFLDTTTYHQAAGSPTIDHGTTDAYTGTTDLDRDARPQGSAMDIGADEVVVARDTTPPETTITKGPKKRTTATKATFTFSSEPAATFTCRLDKKAAKPCSSPYKAKKLKPGRHKFTVFATDTAGNADPTPLTYKWKVKKKHHR